MEEWPVVSRDGSWDGVDWAGLSHAYGPAADMPGQLRGLTDPDPDVRSEAVDLLWGAVLHQGTIYPVTAPVVTAVGQVLASGQAARDVVPMLRPWLAAPQRPLWQAAAAAVARWARLLGDPATIAGVAQQMAGEARRAQHDQDRAAWMLALRDLGADTTAFLDDRSQVVRACAALSAAATSDPRSLAEILAALAAWPRSDHWLRRDCPFIEGWFRFTLIEAAISQGATFGQLLPAALRIAAAATPHTVKSDWGPLLRAAVDTAPAPGASAGAPLSEAARRYVRALADNDALWNTTVGNGSLYLRGLALPEDRDGFRKLAA